MSRGASPARRPRTRSRATPARASRRRLDAAAIAAKFAELKSSDKGLTSEDARARLAKDGPNAIVAKEEPLWHKLFGYFWGPIPWMIEAAAIISLARQDWPDFIVVTGLLIYNAAVGFWQDAKAASALAALKKGLALKAQRAARRQVAERRRGRPRHGRHGRRHRRRDRAGRPRS